MRNCSPRIYFIGLAMLLAAGLAIAMKPTQKTANAGPKFNLETMVPKQFGDWRLDESIIPIMVSPDVQERLDKIYDQTLVRTYINSKDERIMLSIAYGGNQSDSMSAHKPEVCYPAQGFEVVMRRAAQLILGERGAIPVKRLVAVRGERIEPITYWITVGDEVTRGDVDRKLASIKAGLLGLVPDGMLVRVSNIDGNSERAFALQDDYVTALTQALSPSAQIRFLGRRDEP